eukprot:TRINITY_DN31623_c0_g5_i2.p1 TRINITY_DN31623_c0_g5~~TRINITY_DN31623_c0_g5_i2.p1  ORF type:complete len:401 (+),score=85.17 TRINITY_DN31623_c0_g5_i2:151-1353(+)
MDSTMVDNYQDLMDHYHGIKKSVRRKRHGHRYRDDEEDEGDAEGESDGQDYGNSWRQHATGLSQLSDGDYEGAEGRADEDHSEDEGDEDDRDFKDREEEYESSLKKRLKEGRGSSPCRVCYEAVKGQRANCQGYEQVGFICVHEYCAACEPRGVIGDCATQGPPGSAPDAFTGRCVLDSTTTATTTACPSLVEKFDCQEGVMRWREEWSMDKQLYCCQAHQLGCPTGLLESSSQSSSQASSGASESAYDYFEGSSDEDGAQSADATSSKGSSRSPEEECHYGLDDFERNWVASKKEYCCKRFSLGCKSEHVIPVDEATSHSLEQSGEDESDYATAEDYAQLRDSEYDYQGEKDKAHAAKASNKGSLGTGHGMAFSPTKTFHRGSEDTSGVPPVLVELFGR